MCFAIPKKIKSIDKKMIITTDGVRAKKGDLSLELGDYVLIYGNAVVEKISASQATQSLRHIRSVADNKR